MKILLIEDELSNIEMFKGLLEKLGHQVLAFEDGEIGIAHYDHGNIDLVITDMNLGRGKLNGLGVCKAIRDKNPAAIVVLWTGEVDPEKTSFDFVLSKPFFPRHLKEFWLTIQQKMGK